MFVCAPGNTCSLLNDEREEFGRRKLSLSWETCQHSASCGAVGPMQQPLNSRIRLADHLQGSLRDEEVAAPLATTSRVPSRTRLLAERALSPFFAPESTDTDPRVQPRRLVRRDSAFHQSSGKINMHRGLRAGQLLGLAQKDWYHVWRCSRTGSTAWTRGGLTP